MTTSLVRLVALAITLVLGACTVAAAPSLVRPDVSGGVAIVASGTAFDRATIDVPANRAFALVFENRDGDQHNVSIGPVGGGAQLFVGEIFGGPAVKVYAVPALAPGRYTFHCDVHSGMTGTLVSG